VGVRDSCPGHRRFGTGGRGRRDGPAGSGDRGLPGGAR
jgi:hypothetical protein